MAAEPDEARMRSEVQKLLGVVDLQGTSIGALREQLETRLGLQPGALDKKRDEVNKLVTSEVQAFVAKKAQAATQADEKSDAAKAGKRKAIDDSPTEQSKKEKKKDKKDKDKKEKKHKEEEKDKITTDAETKIEKDEEANKTVKDAEVKIEEEEDINQTKQNAEVKIENGEGRKRVESTQDAVSADQGPSSNGTAMQEAKPPEKIDDVDTWLDLKLADDTLSQQKGKETNAISTIDAAFDSFDLVLDDAKTDTQKVVATPVRKPLVLSGGEDGQLRLWDVDKAACKTVLEGHTGAVRSLAVDWHRMEAMSGADDGAKFWSLKGGGCQRTFSDAGNGCSAVAVEWDGELSIGGCGDGKLKFWHYRTGGTLKSVMAHGGGVWALDANWDDSRLASGGDTDFKIWNIKDYTCVRKLDGPAGSIMCLSVNWELSQILVGTTEKTLQFWKFDEARKPSNFHGHAEPIAHVHADWPNMTAYTAAWDGTVRRWDVSMGKSEKKYECTFGRVRSMAVTATGEKVVCGGSDGKLHVIDLRLDSEATPLEGHVGAVTAVQVAL